MKHLKLFEDFNMGQMFKDLHGAVDPDALLELEPLVDMKAKGMPSRKQFDAVVKFLDADPKYFFYNPKSQMEPFLYWKDNFYQGFFGGLDMEMMKMMKMDKRFEMKKNDMAKYIKNNDWDQMFSRTDKKILIPQFIKRYPEIPDDQKYEVFMRLYQRSEYGFSTFPEDIIKDLFPHRKKSKEWRKRMRELKRDMKLNDNGTVTVYRGVTPDSTEEDKAFSWTLQEETAEFFKKRFSTGRGEIITKEIDPDEIIDYLTGRGEAEVIVVPPAFKRTIKS